MGGEEGRPLRLILSEAGLFVEDANEAQKLHSSSYFGEYVAGKLRLTEVETLYLLERGKAKVFDESGREISFEELVKRLSEKRPRLWLEYLIYSDLRRRGYIVKEGFSDRVEFRVYRRGAKVGEEGAKFLIYGVPEGEPLNLNELYEMVKTARSLRKEPVLAIVNTQGEVCYYAVSLVTL